MASLSDTVANVWHTFWGRDALGVLELLGGGALLQDCYQLDPCCSLGMLLNLSRCFTKFLRAKSGKERK
eukprot:2937528-Ditylum_brightwellii.AAC.1